MKNPDNDPTIRDREAWVHIEQLKIDQRFMDSLANPRAPDGDVNRLIWREVHEKAYGTPTKPE